MKSFWNGLTSRGKVVVMTVMIAGIVVVACALIYTHQAVPVIEALWKTKN